MGLNPIPPAREPTREELVEGGLPYLREKYAIGFITIDELEEGVHSVLTTGAVNVPRDAPLPERERPFRSAP